MIKAPRLPFASLLVVVVMAWSVATAHAQALGGADKARPVAGDPGISSMVVMDRPDFRVLRDYAEPGATRRLHSHDDATYHVFVLVTGQLLLTIEGESPVEVTAGQVLDLKGGAKHTFKNTGSVTATIVEVFGKAKAAGDARDARYIALDGALDGALDAALAHALANAFAAR